VTRARVSGASTVDFEVFVLAPLGERTASRDRRCDLFGFG
jgi:hypothetical protein